MNLHFCEKKALCDRRAFFFLVLIASQLAVGYNLRAYR